MTAALVCIAWAIVMVTIAAIPYRWRKAHRLVDRVLFRPPSPPRVRDWENRPETIAAARREEAQQGHG